MALADRAAAARATTSLVFLDRGLIDAAAITEYERLTEAYPSPGYDVHVLPKLSVSDRADLVLSVISAS